MPSPKLTLKRIMADGALTAVATIQDDETRKHVTHYARLLNLEHEPLRITTSRREFQKTLGRSVSGALGGAYVFHPKHRVHLILINLERIDRAKPRAVELVVAEELVHMRDWVDGDRRRHAKHGYDRIAHRVADLTGASLDDIRSCLLPVAQRPVRYLYRCPGCDRVIERRRRGTWSCGRCSPKYDERFVFVLDCDLCDTIRAEERDVLRHREVTQS